MTVRNIYAVMRRQFLSYFRTPLGYAVIAVFSVVVGLSFSRLLSQSASEPVQAGDILFGSAYFWLMLMAAIALVTMSLFAEERHAGTLELLLTAPVTDVQVVVGKFLAAFAFIAVVLAPVALHCAILFLVRAEGTQFPLKPVLSGCTIVLLITAFYTAFGMLMSSLTRSVVVSAILCCAGMSVTFLAESLQYAVGSALLERVFAQVSSVQHILDFSRGIVDSQPVVFYLSGVVFFMYLTVKSLESRLWR